MFFKDQLWSPEGVTCKEISRGASSPCSSFIFLFLGRSRMLCWFPAGGSLMGGWDEAPPHGRKQAAGRTGSFPLVRVGSKRCCSKAHFSDLLPSTGPHFWKFLPASNIGSKYVSISDQSLDEVSACDLPWPNYNRAHLLQDFLWTSVTLLPQLEAFVPLS